MFRCLDCKSLFEEPSVKAYHSGEYGTTHDYYCPECGGECFEEVFECPSCHEYRSVLSGCRECATRARALLNEFALQHGDAMLEIMDTILEGESLFDMREVKGD